MKTAKGFTLIELLVVITIIGILATGATALYSGSQQKARDGVRMNDATVMKGAVEQAYTDISKYPTADADATAADGGTVQTLIDRGYLGSAPVDTNIGVAAAGSTSAATEDLGMLYNADSTQQKYDISVAFEAAGNVGTGLKTDEGGDNNNRFEVGNGILDIKSVLKTAEIGSSSTCTTGTGNGTPILITAKTGAQTKCSES